MKKRLWLYTAFGMISCLFCFYSVHGSSLQRPITERHALYGYTKGNVRDGELIYLQAPPEDPHHTDEDKRQPPPVPEAPEDPDENTEEAYYAVLCIGNNTSADIVYQYKWGEDAWESVVLKGKERKLHARPWKEKEDGQTFPDFRIKFSLDISGKSPEKESVLKAYLAPGDSCNFGKGYHFKRKGQHIDLTED